MDLLSPSIPARGMQSDPDPTTLAPGIWRLLQNVRCRKNTVYVRNGSSKICDTVPVANASLRGYWTGYLNGAIRLVGAFRVGSYTRLYAYDLSGNTWSELTASSGRMATDGQVQFAAAKTRSGESVTGIDILIAANGSDVPTIWKVAANTCSPLVDPGVFASGRQQPYFQNAIQMSLGGTRTRSSSTKFDLIIGSDYLTIAVDTTCTTSQTVSFTGNNFAEKMNSAVGSMTLNGQLAILVMNATSTAAYDRITKVEVYDSVATTWKTIWDPTSATTGTYVVRTLPGVTSYANVRLFCYPANDLEGISITGVKFSCDNGPAAGSETSIIAYVGTTGKCLSSTLFASSVKNKASYAEGTAVVAKVQDAPTFYNSQGSSLAAKVRLPIDASVFCSYYTAFMCPYGFTPSASSVDLYASIGGTPFGYVSEDAGTDVSGLHFRYDTYVTSCQPDYLYTAYDDQCRLMPTGGAITSANGRVFIGSGADLWASALDDPMKWRGAVIVDAQGNVDQTSSVYRTFQGEKITAINPLSGTIFGVSSILVWTLGNTYRVTGSTASEIGSYVAVVGHRGTRHPYSISIMDGAVWFLDSENHVRYTNGGNDSAAVSLNKVNGRITAGNLSPSGIDRVTGLASFDTFVLFYPGVDPATGTADTTALEGLVFDQVTGEWVLDRFPFDVAGAVTIDDGTNRRLLGITETGKVWELYKSGQATENGSNLPLRMEGPEIVTPDWETKFFGNLTILSDSVTGTTWNTVRTAPIDGATANGTINVGVATAMAWRKDITSGGGNPGLTSVSCIPLLYGSAPAGTRIRQMKLDVANRSGGPDVG
jgi:hypothetical protein